MSNASNMITLKSSDGEVFEVEETALVISQTIKHMIEDGCADDVIPLPNVTGKILSKVIQYCKKRVGEDDKEQKDTTAHLKAFDDEFVKLDSITLFELLMAANYLHIKSLMDLTCQTIADTIKDKSVEAIRKLFNITNDFTPEEEAEVQRQHQWAHE